MKNSSDIPDILILGPTQLCRDWIKLALLRGRFRVWVLSSEEEALRYLEHTRCDAVVVGRHPGEKGRPSDVPMIRRAHPHLPVISCDTSILMKNNAGPLDPGGFHTLILCTQAQQIALQRKVERKLAVASRTSEGRHPRAKAAG